MPVSDENFRALGRAMAAGAPACGIQATRIRALAPGVAEVTGTGVSVFWSSDAHEDGPGWLVRESFSVPSEQDRPPVTQTVARIPEDETVRAAKCALMLVVERRLDVAFSRMG